MQMYIDDSLGERVWVDREDCKGFVENIQTAFRTKASPRCLLVGGLEPAPGGGNYRLNMLNQNDKRQE